MKTMRTALALTAALGALGGCGNDNSPSAKAASFEEAIGLDQSSIKARETKVQEAIRACMKDQGFEYIPIDTSQMNIQIRIGGIGSDTQDVDTLRKEGYGITTGFMAAGPGRRGGDTDPNQAIRDQLSESDREAYDVALWGDNRPMEDADGGMRMARRAGEAEEPAGSDGCFGESQRSVPGGPEELGDDLQQLSQRIENDPRIIDVNRDWAACMAESGYTDWEEPDEIPEYLMGKLEQLDPEDEAAMGALRDEELKIAGADADCTERTKRAKVVKEVTDEEKQRFLDEHPNLSTQ